MQIGSLVITKWKFNLLQKQWPQFTYPKQGDILTIKDIQAYPYKSDWVLLIFEELDNAPPGGICSRCFREIQGPMDLEELVKECNDNTVRNY